MNEYIENLLKLASVGAAALNKAASEGVSAEDFIEYLGEDIETIKTALEEDLYTELGKEAEESEDKSEEDADDSDKEEKETEEAEEKDEPKEAAEDDMEILKKAALSALIQARHAQETALEVLRKLAN